MCCFAGPVMSVSDTNLFARMTGDGKQMLAYQMKFESVKENAMILPLPVATPAREDSLRFISLKEYGGFFRHLNKAFPKIRPEPTSRIDSRRSLPLGGIDSKLEVHEVGDFVASFVPTMDDFSRLDQRFVIPKSSWEKIPQYSDYGFAVFQLKNLKGKPHPMAFEFETRLKDEIFFPTVHIHDGQVHQREEFDHTLYLQNAAFDKVVGKYKGHRTKDDSTGFVRSKDVARQYCNMTRTEGVISPDLLLHRIELAGRLENKDIITPIAAGKSGTKGFRLGQVLPFAPALLGMCGLGWVVNRRNKIQESSSPNPKA